MSARKRGQFDEVEIAPMGLAGQCLPLSEGDKANAIERSRTASPFTPPHRKAVAPVARQLIDGRHGAAAHAMASFFRWEEIMSLEE